MQISARNQLEVKIAKIKEGAVNSEIIANLGDGGTLCAQITLKSQKNFELEIGDDAIFIFKAPNVIVAKYAQLKISVPNQLKVKISEIKIGAVNSEIIAKIGDYELCAIITNDSVKNLDLKNGDEVLFLVNPSDIIVLKKDK